MILPTVRDTILRHKLLQKGDKVVVGVSGGPDSLALLYTLYALRKEFALSLHIAHLDHALRKGSSKDSEFVRKIAAKLGLPVTCARAKIKKISGKGSIEEIARKARLEFLFRAAAASGSNKIALGHNLDDQAETVLMRILRGSGLYGMAGILPKRKIFGRVVIRPLIETTRRQIESFLRRKKIKPRLDPTNLEEFYLRNKIRHRLIPLLEKEYNPQIKILLSNMAGGLAGDYDYLLQQALKNIPATGNAIGREKLLRLHPALRRLILRLLISRLQGDTRRITFKHIQEIEDLLLNRPVGSLVNLPKGLSALKKKKLLLFCLK